MANDYFKKLNAGNAIPFMEGREKGEKSDILDKALHFEDFGFITTENGECAVVAFTEIKDRFYFMNSVVTEMLHKVEADNMIGELSGHSIVFTMKANQKGTREYMAFEFVD